MAGPGGVTAGRLGGPYRAQGNRPDPDPARPRRAHLSPEYQVTGLPEAWKDVTPGGPGGGAPGMEEARLPTDVVGCWGVHLTAGRPPGERRPAAPHRPPRGKHNR